MSSKYSVPSTLLAICLPICAFSQSVISTAGNEYYSPSYYYAWTMGEPIIGSLINQKTLTQGFHQSEWTILSSSEMNLIPGLRIYPNPSSDNLTIVWEKQPQHFEVIIYDASGKLAYQKTFHGSGNKIRINVSELVAGFFSILIQSKESPLRHSFKLLKTQ